MDKQTRKKGFFAYYLSGLFVRMNDNNLFLLCGGLAFATLLCLVPLVFLIFFVLEVILDVGAIAHLINRAVDMLIPYREEAEYLKKALFSRASGVMTFKKAYGVSGLLILILSVSSLFSSMRTLLNAVFKIEHSFGPKEGETEPVAVGQLKNMGAPGRWIKFLHRVLPIAVGKLKDITMVLLILSIFLLSVLSLPILSAVIDIAPSLLHDIYHLLLWSYLPRPNFCRVSRAILAASIPTYPDKGAGYRCFLGRFAVETHRMDLWLLPESLRLYIVSVRGLCSVGGRGLVDIPLGDYFYFRCSDRPTLPRKASCRSPNVFALIKKEAEFFKTRLLFDWVRKIL